MTFFLIVDIRRYPREVPRTERYDPITALPLQCFPKLMRTSAFHLADPRVDLERRKKRRSYVNVVGNSPYRVEIRFVGPGRLCS